jgi:uncharacterized membrane protein
MESKARLLGHPVHQMLIVFPLGLLATSVIFDVLNIALTLPGLAAAGYYLIWSGVIGGLVAAPFGTIDWLAIPHGTRARSVGAMHGLGNVIVLLLFATSGWLRIDAPQSPPGLAVLLSVLGAALAMVTAWLGGELVDRLGIGISDNAGLDAPSSLHARDDANVAAAHGGMRH